jgi:hypothetical protein
MRLRAVEVLFRNFAASLIEYHWDEVSSSHEPEDLLDEVAD